MPFVPFLLAEHSHGKPEMYSKQNEYADFLLSTSGQKEIKELLKKDIFKVVTPNKVVMLEEIPSNTKGFNSYFFEDIRDPCINKAHKKSRFIIILTIMKRKILY